MSVIEAIQEFLSTCPLLEGGYININRLEMEDLSYTIDEVAAEPVLKRYSDGGALCQTLFLFASSESFSRDAVENLKTCGFYEAFSRWLEEQSDKGSLPKLDNGTAQRIEAITNGYSFETNEEQSIQRYQIQCRLTYLKG